MTRQTHIRVDIAARLRRAGRARGTARGRGRFIRIGAVVCAVAACMAAGRVVTVAKAIPTLPPALPSCLGSFGYTGAEVACAVPAGVTALHVVATGGSGGNGGGLAGVVQRDVSGVYAGEPFFVYVGGNGGIVASGWNGGGFGGGLAGGGGGASDVRQDVDDLQHRVVVAAGGGGGAEGVSSGAGGGFGGSAWLTADGGAGGAPELGEGGGGGTEYVGGAGGTGGQYCPVSGYGLPGGLGYGGAGRPLFDFGGGGGGGGYFGGGGGGGEDCSPSAGGGGAGSNYPPNDVVQPDGILDFPGPPQVSISAPVPTLSSPPTISGTLVPGELLSESHASWANGASGSYSYQWLRCSPSGANCVPIPGQTSDVYRVTSDDVGSALVVTEVASNFYGTSAPASSAATSAVTSGIPMNVAAPTINGSPVAGQVLTAQLGGWSNSPTSFRYQWLRCDRSGRNCQPIAGQTRPTYALTAQDVQSTMSVQEVAVDAWGSSQPATSSPTAPVSDAGLTVQTFALVGTAGSIVPGPIASFSQPGESGVAAANYAATVFWGDGTISGGTVLVGRSGNYLVDASHAYTQPGNYSLVVTVTAGTGATAQSTNRVSVFAAAVCPKGSDANGHNCLAQISLPAGCLAPGAKLRVSIPSTKGIRRVRYAIDSRRKAFSGSGRRFVAALPTIGLASGTHRLTARITFRSGHPPRLSKTRRFAIC